MQDYPATIDSPDDIHDGDTIENVLIAIPHVKVLAGYAHTEIFPPNLFADEDGHVYLKVDIRLAGIDAPEVHPHRRAPDGKPRLPGDIAYERQLAQKARQFVVDTLTAHHLQFTLKNIAYGKFASRLLAEVWAGETNLSTALLEKGLAVPYEGGKKTTWKRPTPTA